MKTKTVALSLVLGTSVFAQGTVRFDNHIPGVVVTHVYGPDPADPSSYRSGFGNNDFNASTGGGGTVVWNGAPLEGTGFSAQIWAAPGVNQPFSSLRPASPITSFGTGADAGFFVATTATLSGILADGGAATIQLHVWDNHGGTIPTWLEAFNQPYDARGSSPLFNVLSVGGTVNPPADLVGLQSFNITMIPEPSTVQIWGVGVFTLSIVIRRHGPKCDYLVKAI